MNIPLPPADQMRQYLLTNGWDPAGNGWKHPNTREFGPGIYSLEHAYREQYECDRVAKEEAAFDERHQL